MKLMRPAILALGLLPAALFGANKEMVQLQRDVALLQEDVKTLQRSLDEKMSALRTLVEQTLRPLRNPVPRSPFSKVAFAIACWSNRRA